MTNAEYLQNRIDAETNFAIQDKKRNEADLVQFHLNARMGFEKRREQKTLQELGETHNENV